MAYRISYGERARQGSGGWTVFKTQVLLAGGLLACLVLTKAVLPGWEERLAGVFLPERGTATQTMAQTLRDSGSVRQAVVAFCRQVLEAAHAA